VAVDPGHPLSREDLADLAVALALGGDCLADVACCGNTTGLAEDAYARLAASSWQAIRGTAVPIGPRMTAVAALS